MLGVHGPDLSVCRDDLRGQQRVDGHAQLACHVADAATERDAADADRPGVAEADEQAVLLERLGQRLGRPAAARPGGPALDVDLERTQVADIQHEAAVGVAVAEVRVAAGAHGQWHAVFAGESDDA